jgi:hypothetical protein
MKRISRVLVVVFALALVVALTGAGFSGDRAGVSEYGSASGASVVSVAHLSSGGSPVDPALVEALRFAPPVGRSAPYEVDFTDWARIESSGSFRLSANATRAQQEAFIGSVSETGVPIAGQGFETTLFPFSSLRWEGVFTSQGAPLDVAGFRPGFAMSQISDRLKSCGFTPSVVSSFVIYAGSFSQVEKCAGSSGIGLPGLKSVYAIDAKGQVVVMSTSPSAVRAAISGAGLAPGSRPLADVLVPLSADPVVTIDLGTSYCKLLTHDIVGPHATAETTQAALHDDPVGAPYVAFGVGYSLAKQPPTARIVMDYGDTGAASAQLSVRERLLKTDYSFIARYSYSKYLALESAAAQGDSVVLTVKPASGNRLILGAMSEQYDLAFARC